MAEARTDAERLRNLLGLWERLAVCWTDSRRVDRLRVDVIARMQSAASSLAGVWLNQALALSAWDAVAAEIQPEPAVTPPNGDWAALQASAEQLRRRVEEEQRTAKSRLTKLLPSAKEQQNLFGELAAFLQQSSEAFAKLAATPPPVAPPSPVETIQQQIEQELAAAPNG